MFLSIEGPRPVFLTLLARRRYLTVPERFTRRTLRNRSKGFFVERSRPHGVVKSAKGARDRVVTRVRGARERAKKPAQAVAAAPLRERVLNAAFSAFMEKGYEGTSTLEIATRAKVSKRELYQVCSDKSALLKDAITERAQRMRLPLELPAATDRTALAATLTALGASVLRGVSEPPVLGVYRLAIANPFMRPRWRMRSRTRAQPAARHSRAC